MLLPWREAENLREFGIQERKSGGSVTRRRAPELLAVGEPCAASGFRVLVANQDGGTLERGRVVRTRRVRFIVVNACGRQRSRQGRRFLGDCIGRDVGEAPLP